ncbi:MAG: T9SS type A sorting domain-containing protein [Saprospiraceae bacterium]|nr:T9SS type A sorting domain-containing protein [Saprospiraceae bacterium]MDP4999014.1 T9SS type A sorting domain-containing protein [Saprospiraceae bacterium]
MTRYLITLIATLLCLPLFSQEIEIPRTQMSLITKKTAVWCPYCGDWGWNMYKGLVEDNASRALMLSAHYSGDLSNSTAIALTGNFGGAGQPRFYLGHRDQGVNSGNMSTKRADIKAAVSDAYENGTPLAQTGFRIEVSGQTATVQTATRFFSAAEGTYRLGAYLVRKTLNYSQAGRGSMADHTNLLIRALGSENFGKAIVNGSVAAETLFNETFQVEFEASEKPEDYLVATILWKEVNGKFEFVNTNFSDLVSEVSTSVNSNILAEKSLTLAPNPVADVLYLSFSLKQSVADARISIRDLQGRELRRVLAGSLEAGPQALEVNNLETLPAGVYVVQFNLGGSLSAVKWVKQ